MSKPISAKYLHKVDDVIPIPYVLDILISIVPFHIPNMVGLVQPTRIRRIFFYHKLSFSYLYLHFFLGNWNQIDLTNSIRLNQSGG